jgi:hypothetical protein
MEGFEICEEVMNIVVTLGDSGGSRALDGYTIDIRYSFEGQWQTHSINAFW